MTVRATATGPNRCSACGTTIGKGKCLYCAMARMVGASTTLPPIAGRRTRELPRELAAEPIVAWRSWGADESGVLRSIGAGSGFPDTWATRDATARCDRCTYLFGTPPGLNCTCGLYALKEAPPTGVVSGKVALYGKVIEHERGYRAQHARILELHTDDPMLAALLRLNYGVPVTDYEAPKPSEFSIFAQPVTASPPAPQTINNPFISQTKVTQGALAGLPLDTISTKRRGSLWQLALAHLNMAAVGIGLGSAAADGRPSWLTMVTVGNALLVGIFLTLYLRPRP